MIKYIFLHSEVMLHTKLWLVDVHMFRTWQMSLQYLTSASTEITDQPWQHLRCLMNWTMSKILN